MPVSDGVRAHIDELLSPMDGVTIRRMFGGLGLFRGGVMFGAVVDDLLYLRAGEANRQTYEAEGGRPLMFRGPNGAGHMSMPYWTVPERLLDDGEELRVWALTASEQAIRDKADKPAKRPKTAKAGKSRKPAAKRAAPARRS
jgi:DNA transformation protein